MKSMLVFFVMLVPLFAEASELEYPRRASARGIESVCWHDSGTVSCDVPGVFEESVLKYANENNLSNNKFCVAFSMGSVSCKNNNESADQYKSEDQYIAECADMIKQKYNWIYFDFRNYQFDYDGNRSVFFHVSGRNRSNGSVIYRTGVCKGNNLKEEA